MSRYAGTCSGVLGIHSKNGIYDTPILLKVSPRSLWPGGLSFGSIFHLFATPEDTATIFHFIKELAEYEKLSHEVVSNESMIRERLFYDNPKVEYLIAEENGTPSASPCSSITSPPSSAATASILKISMSPPMPAAKALARNSSRPSPNSPKSAAVAGLNGGS